MKRYMQTSAQVIKKKNNGTGSYTSREGNVRGCCAFVGKNWVKTDGEEALYRFLSACQ